MFSFIDDDKKALEHALEAQLASRDPEQDAITEAMRYSALGGKMLRGTLTLEAAKMFGCGADEALPYAAAIECVQAYSLIHDDLPCMDDDDTRRGKPSCHIAFGEAMAVLAGDALLTHAFSALAESDSAKEHPERAIKAVRALADYAGFRGMVGGQVLDLSAAEHEVSVSELAVIHRLKTGALIKAAVLAGCFAAGAADELCSFAENYAGEFGAAFQIIDDILDYNEDKGEHELNSYVAINGIDKAKADAYIHISKAGSPLFELDSRGYDTGAFATLLDLLITRMENNQ